MRKPDPELVAHRDILTGKLIELISTIVFLGGWIGALIILATPIHR